MCFTRLRVEISVPGTAEGVCYPRDETIIPWLEPLSQELTIRDLELRIKARFAELYPNKG